MKKIGILLFLSLVFSTNSFNFGETSVKLIKLNGGTATLKIFTQFNGTTTGSDLTISNLKIVCDPKIYKLTCISSSTLYLSNLGTDIQCSVEESVSTDSSCGLIGNPTIQSTGDNFIASQENQVIVEESKFGDTQIGLLSVEGKKTVIKIYPKKTGITSTNELVIRDLTVNNKALTCKAGKILTLEASTGTELECSTTEEIEANIACSLGGNPKIFSKDDTFDDVTYRTNKVYSSFGKVKIGLVSIKGTTVGIELIPEYKGSIKVDITGLQINETRSLDCPETTLNLAKDGVNLMCIIAQAVEDGELCVLTQNNLYSKALPKIEINEDKKNCTARSSKYGKVIISLDSVYSSKVIILIKTDFSAPTESNKFTIDNLKLTTDNKDYLMTCSLSTKLSLSKEGTEFTCYIYNIINGGKECSLKGAPIFNSVGDTFGDITISSNSVFSSFGGITITPVSVIGKDVRIKLSSEITGTTTSSIVSINNLKIGENNMTCPIGVNINFSDKPEFICSLTEIMGGNIDVKLRGDNPIIIKQENSKDVFGSIILSTKGVTSSFGKLEIDLVSVIGKAITISLKSEFIGNIINLNIYGLYLNQKSIDCYSQGEELILKDKQGNSSANIECYFYSSDYSQQSNTECELTGTPRASKSLFSTLVIKNSKVFSGIRNFGETILYLNSIKGTTVYIEIKPSLSGKVRPIINNLKIQGGTEIYEVTCDVADKKQLYKNYRVSIKCYIKKTINENTLCHLKDDNVTITSDTGDIFGNVVISPVNIKPIASTFGNTVIKLVSVIGAQVNINILVSSTTIISKANPIIHNLYLGSSELYCVSTQILSFTNNMAQMSCTSSTAITCKDCQLTGTPTIISSEGQEATFGDTTIETKVVKASDSTLGYIYINLKEVIGNIVYLGISSTNNGKDYNEIDISNLYVGDQPLTCSDNIKFSTIESRVKCTVKETIPYNKAVTLTGTPSIKIYSDKESADVVQLSEVEKEIYSKSNSALIIKLISVQDNFATISITATGLTQKTLFYNFTAIGLAINEVPLELNMKAIYLSNNALTLQVKLNEAIEKDVPCSLKGISTAQISADRTTFGPITNPNNNIVYSSSFKFGEGTITLLYVQGYSVILRITSTKTDYTKNTEINDLYLNNNIPLNCKFRDDIEFNSHGTDVECKLSSPMTPNVKCTLSYEGYSDVNFKYINVIDNSKIIYSSEKNFGDVTIGLREVNGKNVKIFVKTTIQNVTTTNNVRINNLFVNNRSVICEFNDYIEFDYSGNILDCQLNSLDLNETFTLTGNNIQITSFGDKFGYIKIDDKNKTIRTSPQRIEVLTISLSSVAGDRVSVKLTTSYELYTYLQISNLKIKNVENFNTYNLTCPKIYISLVQKNSYSDIIICELSTKLTTGLSLSLINNIDIIAIDSYDKFEEIIIETNAIKSTQFGDIIINYISSSIVLGLYPLYQDKINKPININNIKLNSTLVLDCDIPDSIELKQSGTMIYCTFNGINKVEGIDNKPAFIETSTEYNIYNNIFLEHETNNLNNVDCYALYDKSSCELNNNCIFAKETYGYCINKINNLFNTMETNNCYLYLNEEACNENYNCIWNVESKYICKPIEIENCKKLSEYNLNSCEECQFGYEVNNCRNKCVLQTGYAYPCKEYNEYSKCNSQEYCEYIYGENLYYYCTSKEDNDDNDCYLYLNKETCESQNKCSWNITYNSRCHEKYINYCLKLNKTDPSYCEQCEEGYQLVEKTCHKISQSSKEQCDNYIDLKDNCTNLYFCEFSNRPYCYGENENCYLFLDQTLCENNEECFWNTENVEKCQIKSIPNCLRLSSEYVYYCDLCEDGYYLSERYCKKNEEPSSEFPSCYEYLDEEEICLYKTRCEFTQRNYCEIKYTYNEDYYGYRQCWFYLDKTQCEKNSFCFWNEVNVSYCHIKAIDNCIELNYNNSYQCEKCKEGYRLLDNSTGCQKTKSSMINISLITFAFIIILMYLD